MKIQLTTYTEIKGSLSTNVIKLNEQELNKLSNQIENNNYKARVNEPKYVILIISTEDK